MTAKEYLQQIEVLNKKINHRIREAECLHALITGGALAYNPDKIQTSVGRVQEERLEKYIDMQREINESIKDMVDLKHKIIREIHCIDAGNKTATYIEILFRRYIELTPLTRIAEEMGYNYKWLCQLHGFALATFDEQVLNDDSWEDNRPLRRWNRNDKGNL